MISEPPPQVRTLDRIIRSINIDNSKRMILKRQQNANSSLHGVRTMRNDKRKKPRGEKSDYTTFTSFILRRKIDTI